MIAIRDRVNNELGEFPPYELLQLDISISYQMISRVIETRLFYIDKLTGNVSYHDLIVCEKLYIEQDSLQPLIDSILNFLDPWRQYEEG